MGAVLVKHGHPLSVGFNKVKTHPEHPYSIHAEIDCLMDFDRERLNNSTMFIYRENAQGNPAMARPCKDCMKHIKEFGVKRIFYTTNTYPFFEIERIQ